MFVKVSILIHIIYDPDCLCELLVMCSSSRSIVILTIVHTVWIAFLSISDNLLTIFIQMWWCAYLQCLSSHLFILF